MRGAVVLRPEPGNARTAARLEALGIVVQRCPLFVVTALPWTPPDPSRYDALLLTSANAVRHAGPGLHALAGLPVLAVGAATAMAAREEGLTVALTGTSDAAAIVDQGRAHGFDRPLHLTGRDHQAVCGAALPVYASDLTPIPESAAQAWVGQVLLLHSPRAARRCAELVEQHRLDRRQLGIAALSETVATAAGHGWAARAVADRPDDERLVALAASLIDQPGPPSDKWAR